MGNLRKRYNEKARNGGKKQDVSKGNTRRVLSKKQRKKLAAVLERKKRKLNRAELLEKLTKVQAKPEELKFLASTSSVHTLGVKSFNEEKKGKRKLNNITGANKKAKSEEAPESDVTSSEEDESEDKSDGEEMVEVKVTEDAVEEHSNRTTDEINKAGEIRVDEGKAESNEGSEKGVTKPDQLKNLAAEKQERTPAVFIPVFRKPEIQASREQLPIFCEEQMLMEAVRENPVVLVHGETGSGKTTQVPQFLYEAGFTQNGRLIGITEPRRIAAMSMAARVGVEMDTPEKVSYHIRYQKSVSKDTEIKFMTDGVLLKELSQDFFLTRYSVIIIDEAHERSVFSDVLIGLLSRITKVRSKRKDPLKLIIMSATIRVEDFTENPRLFQTPPFLIKLESRQYQVQIHFNIHTPEDYVEAAYKKVCKIHRQLPAGAILVFLTGEQEIQRLCKLLRESFPFKTPPDGEEGKDTPPNDPSSAHKKEEDPVITLPDINLDDFTLDPLNSEDLMHRRLADEKPEEEPSLSVKSFPDASPLHVLPLYSVLPFEEQQKVFEPPPAGTRLCVVATNVAETSITIPRLKYVVDSGKVKTKVYSSNGGGISKFDVVWCSKASANQRAGRCGRTEGGHCYRLYSSAVFNNDFQDFSLPEIQTIPVDDILLQMKAMGIQQVVDFPFPSPPDKEALKAAERRLVLLGALQDLKKDDPTQKLKKPGKAASEFCAPVTPLGREMSRFALSPRFAKMLILSHRHKCIPYVAPLVCALTVPNIFTASYSTEVTETGEEKTLLVNEGIKKIGTGKGLACEQLGDLIILLRTVILYENSRHKGKFCTKNGIRKKAMEEIHQMTFQLLKEVRQKYTDVDTPDQLNLDRPDDETLQKIRRIVGACLIDHVARRIPRDEIKEDKTLKKGYRCLDTSQPVFIHPSSVLFDQLPEYVVYNEMFETSKLYMKGVMEIEPEWIPQFASSLCDFSEPLENPPPEFDPSTGIILCSLGGTFGPWRWTMPVVRREMPRNYNKFCWFAFFFLDGQVCPSLAPYKELFVSHPSVVLKSWAKVQPKIKAFLEALILKEVDSLKALKEIWKNEPKYLLREFSEWIPDEKQMEVQWMWPPDNN